MIAFLEILNIFRGGERQEPPAVWGDENWITLPV
jgi:hypothetical protein